MAWPALSLYLFGVLLWLAYGLLLHAQAVAPTNAAATVRKSWKKRQGLSRSVDIEPLSE